MAAKRRAKSEQRGVKSEERGAKGQERGAKVVRIRQKRSGIGCPPEMRETLKALGFRKMNQVVVRKDNPVVRGMIAKIPHLVEVVK